jgi:hypothetical protein
MLVNIIMRRETIDAILSSWAPTDERLTYSQIKQRLVEKNLIKATNDRSLSRWLNELTKEGTLRKANEGYYLETKPKGYQVFDYLAELRQKFPDYIYEGEVGGWISHLCASTYLNFDDTLIQKIDEKLVFDLISTRMGELFEALYILRNDILKRRCGLAQLKLDDIVVREALFGLLTKSIGEHQATEELVEKYIHLFRSPEKKMFNFVWEVNKPVEDFDYVSHLADDFFFENVEKDPLGYKRELKESLKKSDKYSIEELIDKYIKIQKNIVKKHESGANKEEEFGYSLTTEESELENTYRTAILVKVAESIKALETNTEDFAVILTRHPATMNQYYTPEHILYESMQWAAKPPGEEFLKKVWQETRAEEKTFESMAAERLSMYNSLNKEILESLKSKPWVKNELSKLGDFDEIIRLYIIKRIEHQRKTKESLHKFLDMTKLGIKKAAEKAKE